MCVAAEQKLSVLPIIQMVKGSDDSTLKLAGWGWLRYLLGKLKFEVDVGLVNY